MKIIKHLTFAALAATLLFQTSITRADDKGRDHRDAIITWTKHITAFLPPGGESFATIAGTAEADIGDGTLVDETFNPRVMLTPTSVTFEADYHFIGSKHSLTVHFRLVQGPDQNGVTRGVITGFVKDGWLKGNVVVGEYEWSASAGQAGQNDSISLVVTNLPAGGTKMTVNVNITNTATGCIASGSLTFTTMTQADAKLFTAVCEVVHELKGLQKHTQLFDPLDDPLRALPLIRDKETLRTIGRSIERLGEMSKRLLQ